MRIKIAVKNAQLRAGKHPLEYLRDDLKVRKARESIESERKQHKILGPFDYIEPEFEHKNEPWLLTESEFLKAQEKMNSYYTGLYQSLINKGLDPEYNSYQQELIHSLDNQFGDLPIHEKIVRAAIVSGITLNGKVLAEYKYLLRDYGNVPEKDHYNGDKPLEHIIQKMNETRFNVKPKFKSIKIKIKKEKIKKEPVPKVKELKLKQPKPIVETRAPLSLNPNKPKPRIVTKLEPSELERYLKSRYKQ